MNHKETALMDAVISLARTGADLRGLTVADVAHAAGVGKGTVYEYFETKEQLIARALRRLAESWLGQLAAAVACAHSFSGKLTAFWQKLADARISAHTVARALRQCVEPGALDACPHMPAPACALLDDLLASGHAEGRMLPSLTREQLYMALVGAAGAFIHAVETGLLSEEDAYAAAQAQFLRSVGS